MSISTILHKFYSDTRFIFKMSDTYSWLSRCMQLGHSDYWFNHGGPAKAEAHKSYLFTKSSLVLLVVKIKHDWLILLSRRAVSNNDYLLHLLGLNPLFYYTYHFAWS